ncbi:MAG: sigma-70 family RNA polymerase sigma factor [Rhodovibrionaceae bacterium]
MEQAIAVDSSSCDAARRPGGAEWARALAARAQIDFDRRMAVSDLGKDRPVAEDLAVLLARVADHRDRMAFALLFEHFAPRLKAYLMRLGAGATSAEELTQEAMIMVWRKAGSFDVSQAGVSTWVFRIARNKRIDALRREKRPEFDPEDPALVPEAPEDAATAVARGQAEAQLRAALKTLPEEQAEVVRLAYFEDLAHGAVAEKTGLPLGTVKSRLRLAMARLKAAMQEIADD